MTGPPAPSSSAPARKPPLPPGMVLGPDGKPCKACNSLRSMRLAQRAVPSSPTPSASAHSSTPPVSSTNTSTNARTAAAAFGLLTSGTLLADADDPRRAHCPADVEQLGRATWTFLHTTAAYYPPSPSPAQQSQMLALLTALPALYPCAHCAAHLGTEMARRPPDVSGREGVSRWLCETHNEVNARLGKERFDCARVDERWRDGPRDGSCD